MKFVMAAAAFLLCAAVFADAPGTHGGAWHFIGDANIDGPAAADPQSGILCITSRKHCSTRIIASGAV